MAHHRRHHDLMMQDALYVAAADDNGLCLMAVLGGILFVLGVGAVIGLAYCC